MKANTDHVFMLSQEGWSGDFLCVFVMLEVFLSLGLQVDKLTPPCAALPR